jgi:hypothetical protein
MGPRPASSTPAMPLGNPVAANPSKHSFRS